MSMSTMFGAPQQPIGERPYGTRKRGYAGKQSPISAAVDIMLDLDDRLSGATGTQLDDLRDALLGALVAVEVERTRRLAALVERVERATPRVFDVRGDR